MDELIEYLERWIKNNMADMNPDCALMCDMRRALETAKRYKLAGWHANPA